MDISALTGHRQLDSVRSLSHGQNNSTQQLTNAASAETGVNKPELREAFDAFVGETFYGQMLKAMRKTQQAPAYFDGGQAEKMFREQLDQTLAQKMSETTASSFTGTMFDSFQLNRS